MGRSPDSSTHNDRVVGCKRAQPFLLALGLFVALATVPVRAEMEDREYESEEAAKPVHVLEQRQREIEAELRETARREAAALAIAEAAQQARAAELAARPYAVRLLEARCETVCHDHERFAHNRHTWLGWQVVILRMQYMNGALLDPGDRSDLAYHLADSQPAAWVDAVLEYAPLPVALIMPWLGWLGWRRWKTRERNR
jgi:hypothetical protein